MNKPLHLQQNVSKQAAMENRINRNLSPSLARIQTLAAKVAPSHSEATTDKKEGTPQASQPKLATARPGEAQHLSAEPTGNARNTFQPPPPIAKHHTPVSASPRITPWIIASITLTLALFSGNYAWQTQQQVETLNLRLEQLETKTATIPVTSLPASNDNVAKTEQALLTLSQSQEQITTSVTTLQSTLTADTELANSRLTTLEDALASLSSQVEEVAHSTEESKALLAEAAEKKSAAQTSADLGNSETRGGVENWFINIATFSDPKAASKIHGKVQKIADTASVKPITINGKTLYRIRADGYNSREGAEGKAQALQTQLGLSGLWVSHD